MKKQFWMLLACGLGIIGSVPAFGQGPLGNALTRVASRAVVEKGATKNAFSALVKTWENIPGTYLATPISRNYLSQPVMGAATNIVSKKRSWSESAVDERILSSSAISRTQAIVFAQQKEPLNMDPSLLKSFYLSTFVQTIVEGDIIPSIEQFDQALLFYYDQAEKLCQRISLADEEWILGISLINNIGLLGSKLDGELIVRLANMPFPNDVRPWVDHAMGLALVNLRRYDLLEEFVLKRLEKEILSEENAEVFWANFAGIKALLEEDNVLLFVPSSSLFDGRVPPLSIAEQFNIGNVNPYNLLYGTPEADHCWVGLRRALEQDFSELFSTQMELRRLRLNVEWLMELSHREEQEALQSLQEFNAANSSRRFVPQSVRDYAAGKHKIIANTQAKILEFQTYLDEMRTTSDPGQIMRGFPSNKPTEWDPVHKRYKESPGDVNYPYFEPKYETLREKENAFVGTGKEQEQLTKWLMESEYENTPRAKAAALLRSVFRVIQKKK